jgi:hypothetical protein
MDGSREGSVGELEGGRPNDDLQTSDDTRKSELHETSSAQVTPYTVRFPARKWSQLADAELDADLDILNSKFSRA